MSRVQARGEMLDGDEGFQRAWEVRRRYGRWSVVVGGLTALFAVAAYVLANYEADPSPAMGRVFFQLMVGTTLSGLALAGVASAYQWARRVTEEAAAVQRAILGNPDLLPSVAVRQARRRRMGVRLWVYGALLLGCAGFLGVLVRQERWWHPDNLWVENLVAVGLIGAVAAGFIALTEVVAALAGWLKPVGRGMSERGEMALGEELKRIFHEGALREFMIFRSLVWVGIPGFLFARSVGLV